MTYYINPLSEEELDVFALLDEGVYDFEVTKSTDGMSKSNNPMNTLDLKIWKPDGSVKLMKDYLVFSSVNFCMRKVRHFCEAVGILEEYEKGQIRKDFTGLSGKVELVIKEGGLIPEDKLEGKPIGSTYPTKNEVKDYILPNKGTVKHVGMKPLPEKKDEFNDEIPF